MALEKVLGETVEGFFGHFGPAGLWVDVCGLEMVGPESPGEGDGGKTAEGFAGVVGFLVLIDGFEGFGGVLGKPVESQGGAIVAVMEGPGSPGGEFEDGGTAEAPMGNQQGTLLFEVVLGEADLDVGDGNAGELGEVGGGSRMVKVKREGTGGMML